MPSKEQVLAMTPGADETTWQEVWGFFGFEPTGDWTRDMGAMFGALAQRSVEQHNDIIQLKRRIAALEGKADV